MALALITPPAVEPLSVEEAKEHLRVVSDADAVLINGLIIAARMEAEHKTGRALIAQTWEWSFEQFPQCSASQMPPLRVPKAPLVSVTSIKYTDESGVEQTLAPTEYLVIAFTTPPRIYPPYGKTWPANRAQFDAVKVRFVAGYGTSPLMVPEPIRRWMLVRIATMYENREATSATPQNALPRDYVDGLLDQFIVGRAAA